ncbi:MAG TPA: acyltransferase [Acidimicrobiales bacterium]|jgi:peptidoglycan/LPS O-acetylase OafA/YrhL
MALTAPSRSGGRRVLGAAVMPTPDLLANGTARAGGAYLGQFDSYRVIACCAVVLQHSLLWNVVAGNTTAWALVMLLHFSRTAFFFLTAFLLTYAEIKRPRPVTSFWRQRLVEIGIPFLIWTGIYWVFTMIVGGSWDQAGSLLWNDLVFGYYQLYFVVVLLQLYLVFPLLLRLVRRSTHHVALMVASGLFALALAADLHYTQYFGVVGDATRTIGSVWPWARDPITYQEQFVAGVLVALHFDDVRRFVERRWRQVMALGVVVGVVATMWYLIADWTGAGTGRASDLYQPVAFLWFTAAVAALECGTWVWYRRQVRRAAEPRRWPRLFTAEYLAGLTGGIFFSHVLFLNLLRSALGDSGIAKHLGWAGLVAVTFVLTIVCAGVCTGLLLLTPLRRVLTGPVRAEQRARLGVDARSAETHRTATDGDDLPLQPVLA